MNVKQASAGCELYGLGWGCLFKETRRGFRLYVVPKLVWRQLHHRPLQTVIRSFFFFYPCCRTTISASFLFLLLFILQRFLSSFCFLSIFYSNALFLLLHLFPFFSLRSVWLLYLYFRGLVLFRLWDALPLTPQWKCEDNFQNSFTLHSGLEIKKFSHKSLRYWRHTKIVIVTFLKVVMSVLEWLCHGNLSLCPCAHEKRSRKLQKEL